MMVLRTIAAVYATNMLVYMTILKDSYEHLNSDGELWFVMSKDQGAKSTIEVMKNVYDEVNVINKSKGFFVILCKKR